MEDNTATAMDNAALNLKRKRATQCVAHLTGASGLTDMAAKQLRLDGDESNPSDSGPVISKSLVRYYLNYKKSGIPKRLMFYKDDDWFDFPEDVLDLVKKDFEIKKSAVEVELDGRGIVLDFLHMYHVDLESGLQQPIAWIDEAGCCYFPETFVSSEDEQVGDLNGADDSKLGEYSGESNALAKDVAADGHDSSNKMITENAVVPIKQEQDIYSDAYTESIYGQLDVNSVQHLFLTGMTIFGITEADIVQIYRSTGMSLQSRFELFKRQAEITQGIQGDANVRYAWLACSKEELSKMMEFGLGQSVLSEPKCIFGVGVHLAAATHPYVCAPYCDVDENGVKHLVLCRVIMGNMELLRLGSDQHHPSSSEYDNGVDNIASPKYYVVWNMNVNTHIYPEFIVSFKAILDAEGNVCSGDSTVDTEKARAASVPSLTSRRSPRSPWMPFPMLFAAIKPRITPHQMYHVKAHYGLLTEKKISRNEFIKNLRLIVGDDILRSTITNLQGPSNAETKCRIVKMEN